MKRLRGKEIFAEATVQCQHCGRYFIKPMPHRCNTGFRKHHHKWTFLKNDDMQGIAKWDQGAKLPLQTKEETYPAEFIRWLSICIANRVITLGLPTLYRYENKEYTLPKLYKYFLDNVKGK